MTEEEKPDLGSRTLPHDIQAEQSVLGGMLLSKDAITQVPRIIRARDFYRPAHQVVYQVILDLHRRGKPTDAIMVNDELTRQGEAQRVGGAKYLHACAEAIPTAANAGYYAKIVADKAVLRGLIEVGTRFNQLGRSGEGEAHDLVRLALDEAKAKLTVRSSTPPDEAESEDNSVEGDRPRRLPSADILATDYGPLYADVTEYALLGLANPDGLLGCLLAEVSALIHPERVISTTDRSSYLNLATLIPGVTGSGKNIILNKVARITGPLLEQNPRIRVATGLASGQGLQDAYSGPATEEEMSAATEVIQGLAQGEDLTVRQRELMDMALNALESTRSVQLKRVHDALVLRVEEGRKLFETMNASGSTLASDLVALLTGGATDSIRAHDHGRPSPRMEIKEGEVRLCGTILIQPAYLAHLLTEEQGLMGRLLKVPAGLTEDEIAQARELRADPDRAYEASRRTRNALAQLALNARSGGSLRVSREVQSELDEAAYGSVVDVGWAGVEPEGQSVTLRLTTAGVLSAMLGRDVIDVEAWEVAGMLLRLSREQEERVRAFQEFKADRARTERLSERAATAEVQQQVREPSRRAALLDNAVSGILRALEGGQTMTGSQLRSKCGVYREAQQGYKASTGRHLHVDAITALERDGAVEVTRSAGGKQIRGVRRI